MISKLESDPECEARSDDNRNSIDGITLKKNTRGDNNAGETENHA